MLTAVQLSLAVGTIAAFVALPGLYDITDSWSRQLIGMPLAINGRPTTLGLIIHGIVAACLCYFILHATAPAPVIMPPISI